MDSQNPFAPAPNSSAAPESWQVEAGGGELPVRTTGLTVIMVLFLLFGILGVLVAFGTLLAWLFEETLQKMSDLAGNPFVKKIQESQVAYQIPGFVLAAINSLLSIVLIVSALGIAKRAKWGWSTARVACGVGIFFEIIGLAFAIFLQVLTVMNLSTMEVSQLGENVPEEAAQIMFISMMVGTVFGIIMGSVYGVGKILVYYLSKRYLEKAEIARLFG